MPVMDPLAVCPDYNPTVEDEMLKPIGELNPDSILVLVTLTVPQDVKKMSVNLQAPFIINADERKAIQLIVDPDKYEVRFPIYDIINKEDERMLALSRKKNEALVINNNIEVTVLEIKGDQVKLGITAPKEVPVYRKEVYLQIQKENEEAMSSNNLIGLADLFKK